MRRSPFILLPLLALPAAHAQDAKAPRPLPVLDDTKTDWVAPPKLDAPPNGTTPVEAVPADAPLKAGPSGQPHTRVIDRVHVDEPGDGRVWVMGGNYKASFGTEGVTYVPYFGGDAPRSYPIAFTLREATLGGHSLALGAPSVVCGEDSIALHHGALVERWRLDLMQVEQTFELADLPYAGDLELRIDVTSELALTDVADGLVFEGSHGRVAYGDVTVLDAAGRTHSAPSMLVDGDIVLRVPASFLADAALPVTIDPIVANFFIDRSRSAITADPVHDVTTGRWLVTFQEEYSATDSDVGAVLLNSAGAALNSEFAYIDFTTETWREPQCANNNLADQFLVVATRGANGSREVWGRTRQAASTTMGSQFEISGSLSGEKYSCDVGGDPVLVGPTYYCVVWRRDYAAGDTDIHYQMVKTDSTLLGGTQFVDNSGATEDNNPEISKSNGIAPFATQRWNVVFNRVYSSSDRDIRGAQIDWDGTLVTGSFSIDFSGADHLYPQPSSPLDAPHGERDWACVYQSDVGSHWNIHMSSMRGGARYHDTDLTVLEAGVIGNSYVGQHQGGPRMSADGTQYFVAYHELFGSSTTDNDIYCTTLRHQGAEVVIVEAHRTLAFSTAAEVWPNVASRRDSGGAPGRFAVAWHQGGGATGTYDVEGVLFDVNDVWAAVGTTVCNGASNSTGEPATFRALGSAVRAQNRLRFDVHGLPLSSFGFFCTGQNAGSVAVGQGTFCIGPPFQRLSALAQSSGSFGAIAMPLDLNVVPGQLNAGTTWRFQYWYRDSSGGAPTSNLSNAVAIAFL